METEYQDCCAPDTKNQAVLLVRLACDMTMSTVESASLQPNLLTSPAYWMERLSRQGRRLSTDFSTACRFEQRGVLLLRDTIILGPRVSSGDRSNGLVGRDSPLPGSRKHSCDPRLCSDTFPIGQKRRTIASIARHGISEKVQPILYLIGLTNESPFAARLSGDILTIH
jgi:hypothetical protein